MILDNAQDDESEGYEPGFEGDGFIALCIIYGVSAVANWFAPSVMTVSERCFAHRMATIPF